MRHVFGNRNARIFITSQSLAFVGSNTLWLAMGIWVKILTGSITEAGLTFFAYICGFLLAPLCGMVVDRVRQLKLLLCVDIASAVWVCALFAVHDRGGIWLIYVVLFGYGALSSLLFAGQSAVLTFLLPKDQLGEANSILQIAEQGIRIATPLIGAGLLTLVGPKPVVLLVVATYVAAGIALLFIKAEEPSPQPSGERWFAEFSAGIRFIAKTPELSRLMIAAIIAVLGFGFFVTIPYAVAASALHRPPAFVGVLDAFSGAGALAGGLVAAPLMRRIGESRIVAGGLIVCAFGAICLTTHWLPVVLIGMATPGICTVWVNIGAFTLIQRRTPQGLLGRVNAALGVGVVAPEALSVAVGAAVIAALDYRVLLLAVAAMLAMPALLVSRKPKRRDSVTVGATATPVEVAE